MNEGVPGQTSTGIAERAGVIPIRMSKGGSINGETGIEVSLADLEDFNGYGNNKLPGKLEGISGVLQQTPSIIFQPKQKNGLHYFFYGSKFFAEIPGLDDGIGVIWACRNDVVRVWPAAVCLDNIQLIVARYKKNNRPFIVLSVLNAKNEIPGDQRYELVLRINSRLQEMYPDNYIDIRRRLIDSSSGKGSEVIGPELRKNYSGKDDGIHLNDIGYKLVAQIVEDFIKMKKW